MTPKKKRTYALKKQKTKFDKTLAFVVTGLTIFGILMVYDASIIEAYQQFGDKLHFARLQLMWGLAGLSLMVVVSFIHHQIYQKFALPLFLLTLFFLVLVLIPGIGSKVQGARRWFPLGPVGFQPSELAKITVTIYLSSLLAKRQQIIPFIIVLSLTLGLIMFEPDLGTAVIIATIAILLYFLSGAPLTAIIITGIVAAVIGTMLIFSSPYRTARLKTYLDPTSDPLGASYHIRQILIALGSGGLFGQGIGRSRQKYQYLPEATTDSIFAIVGEELGFLGAFALIGLFTIIIWRGFLIASSSNNKFSQLLASGITGWFAFQVIINLSAMVSLLPLTGVPLPFISYGGSSLITSLSGIGILLNISKSG